MKPRLWLAIFIVLQLADGMLTYAAIDLFGTSAEGNPILATWIMLTGAVPALLGASVACERRRLCTWPACIACCWAFGALSVGAVVPCCNILS